MDYKKTNREQQLGMDKEFIKGVKLIDIDSTIAEYMSDVVIPDLEENGNVLKAPLIYGNAERWAGARKDGYIRDERGRIQIPLLMFKRNSIERNDNMANFQEINKISAYKKYSPKNRYERFSLQNGVAPVQEMYEINVPHYVTVTYEVMIWTSFTEHMNKIVEAFQYATDRYWGKDDGYKMVVNAYLLPERYNEKPVVKKSRTIKRIIFGVETDLTGNLFNQPSLYNEYAQVIDFVAVRGSQMATFVNATTVKLINVKKPILPSELIGVFDIVNWFRIYINGDFVSPSTYTYSYNGTTNEIVFTFSGLGFSLDAEDEISITGKFQEL